MAAMVAVATRGIWSWQILWSRFPNPISQSRSKLRSKPKFEDNVAAKFEANVGARVEGNVSPNVIANA